MNIAINGFGRIGRTSFRIFLDTYSDRFDTIAVNTSGSMDLAGWMHLLKYDSNYGVWKKDITIGEHQKASAVTDEDSLLGTLTIDGKAIQFFAQRDPVKLPWKNLGIDTVIDSTGVFLTKEKASAHIQAGARRVIVSAPPKDETIPLSVLGVTEKLADQVVISNASCTTNSVAPVTAILASVFGIQKAALTTVHAYTDDQNIQDNSHKDLRRARAAGKNIVPTTTGAAIAVTKALPALAGKFDGLAIRVPVSVGSLSDMTFVLAKKTTKEEVNQALVDASLSAHYAHILAVTNDPIVSSDIVGRAESAIVDLSLTQVIDGDLVKVIAWYDNEFGYCNRLVEQVLG